MGDMEATLPRLPPARKFQRNIRKLVREKGSPRPGYEANYKSGKKS
jgi:hypothetical protein